MDCCSRSAWSGTLSTTTPSTCLVTRFDFIGAILTTAATSFAFVVAILTPPKSGPFCTGNCVEYPYTEIAAYVPRDFLWMYPALLPAPLFVILLSVLHDRTSIDRKSFSRVALAFGAMAATVLTSVYFIQLRYVQPAVWRGELDGLAPWTQYNPHGVFIALEDALMGVAFLFAGLALSTENRLLRAVRIIFLLGFASVTTAFVALSGVYGFDVEYRFEVAAITIDWTVLIVVGALLAIADRPWRQASTASADQCRDHVRASIRGRSRPTPSLPCVALHGKPSLLGSRNDGRAVLHALRSAVDGR
ncbi:hypothetical protein D3C83_00520 [compost metagenome]